MLEAGSKAREVYGKDKIVERHRHRYEFNLQYKQQFEQAGLRFSGKSIDGKLMEMIEIPEHPWFIACQFHPEFTSTPRDGHPLFTGYIRAADGSWEIEVQSLRKPSTGIITHEGEVLLGHPKVGDKAIVEVDMPRRHDIMRKR